MFSVLLLFIFTFSLAAIVSFIVVKIFNPYISAIFERIIQDKISGAWHKYIQFAAYITGISGGVNIYRIDDYITENSKIQFNLARWLLEVYRTGISALQSLAWMYLTVFLLALIAFAIVRGFELKYANPEQTESPEKK